jgi:hypothetical protein
MWSATMLEVLKVRVLFGREEGDPKVRAKRQRD